MTINYLNLTRSATLDSNGNGVTVLKPDVGQYWAPDFVKVATVSQSGPFPYAAVYHVSSGVTVGPTSFVDDTYRANNDTSSIISGTIVQFGESITVNWTGGTPGDTAVMTIFGMYSDMPISLGEVSPTSPGTHFTGRLAFSADVPILIDTTGSSFFTLPAGPSDTFFPRPISLLVPYQTRLYNSFRMNISNTSTGTNQYYGVEFQWYSDPTRSFQIANDYFTFPADGSTQYGIGVIRGPYLLMKVHNYDSTTGSLSFALYGSQRPEPRTQFKTQRQSNQGFGTDNVLMSFFASSLTASGGSITTPVFNFYNGPVTLNLLCSTVPATVKSIEVDLFHRPAGELADDKSYRFFIPTSVADAKSPLQVNLTFPRRSMQAQIINKDTNVNSVELLCYAQEL